VFLILLLSVVGSCGQDVEPAIAALRQKDAVKALLLLDPLRERCSQSSAFYEVLGLASELSGNKSAAEEALGRAVALDGRSSRLFTELGATLLQNGKPADAAKALDQALVIDPSNMVASKYAIGAAVESRHWRRASELFQRSGLENSEAALKQEPILILWLAQTLVETKQSDRIDSLLSPDKNAMLPGLLFSLGTLFAQHGMYERAVECFTRVPPESADDALCFNLGLSYSHLQRFDKARQFYFEAIDKHPGHLDAYFHVGLDYIAGGEPRMGIPWLFKAHSLATARSDIAYALAEQLVALEYLNTATEVLAQTLSSAPHDPLLLVADGDLRRAQGDLPAALVIYQKVLAEHPGMPAALVGLARVNLSQGKDEQARALLKRAVDANPQDPLVNGELGLLEAHHDEWDNALEHLGRAWRQSRSNPEIALELARAYQRKKRPQDALQLLASIRPAMQGSSAFHLQLAQLYAFLHRTADAQAERDTLSSLQAHSQDVLHFENPRTYVQ
jgi:tetratricopeptide (TPR) repeat protein